MPYLSRFNSQLNILCEHISSRYPKPLSDAMVYSLTVGGKRVRPSLVYATAETFEVDLDAVDAIALAVECMHTYSLIHDDLPEMDNDDLRRGKPTCHKAFTPATAILAGDALQGIAFEQLARNVPAYASQQVQTLAASSVQMVAGQTLDIAAEGKQDVSLAELEVIHQRKTGELINASILLAYQASQSFDAEIQAKLSEIAFSLGLHFQIIDDIFDVTKTSEELGKPSGSDESLNKTTYVSLLGIESAKEKADNLSITIQTQITELELNNSPLNEIIETVINRKK